MRLLLSINNFKDELILPIFLDKDRNKFKKQRGMLLFVLKLGYLKSVTKVGVRHYCAKIHQYSLSLTLLYVVAGLLQPRLA